MAFRGTLNKQLEARGVKLSVNDFIIKACALALQQVPDANAVWAGDRIIKLKPSDVAVAVAVGLAQNMGALRALATEGIQRGHMALHAHNVAIGAGASGDEVGEVARRLVERRSVTHEAAEAALSELRGR